MSESNVVALDRRSVKASDNAQDLSPTAVDEAAVWRMIEAEGRAIWSQDPEGHRAFHVQAPYEQWWGWNASTGMTILGDWDQVSHGFEEHFTNWPEPNWYLLANRRFENKTIRIVGDVAWVTFDEVCDTDNLPGYAGPGGCTAIFLLLERQAGTWKIAFTTVLDDQFGQTETPIWQIDRTGRMLRRNAAAASHLRSQDSDMVVVNEQLRMRDPANDRRLHQTIARVIDPPGCLFVGSDAAPIVCDPGDDSPVRVWWIISRSGKLYVAFNDPVLLRGRLERAARAFGRSPAQQRLTTSIASGLPLPEVAKREGVRVSTARTQLKRIYEKVGVRGQPALVQAMLNAANPA